MSKYLVILHDAQDNSLAGRAELKLRLCETLHVSPPAVDRLMQSLPVILRRDLEKDVAEKYANTLESLGAVVEAIEEVDNVTHSIIAAGLPEVPAPTPQEAKSDSFSFDQDSDAEISDLESMLDAALQSDDALPQDFPKRKTPSAVPAKQPTAASSVSFTPVVESDDGLSIDFDETPNDTGPSRASILAELMGESAPAAPSSSDKNHVAVHANGAVDHSRSAAAPPEDNVAKGALSAAFARPIASPAENLDHTEPAPLRRSPKLAGMLLLGALGVVFFLALPTIFTALGMRKSSSLTISIDVARLLNEQRSILGLDEQAVEEKKPPVVTGQWSGDFEENGIATHLRLTEMDYVVALATLEVTTPPPPKLTEQEIAAGKPTHVWMRKLEAINLRRSQIDVQPGMALSFVGNGRAYLEDGISAERVLAEVEVNFTAPEGGKDIKAGWRVRRTGGDQVPDAQNEIARVNGKDFRIILRGKAQATREPQKPASEAPSGVSQDKEKK